jgi:prepilin-type N-terminal cleavage/methylation domain-containing protein
VHRGAGLASKQRVLSVRPRGSQLLARARRDESGFTLPELLIAMTAGLVVFGGAIFLSTSSTHSESGVASRSYQIQNARTAIDRIVREVHQGSTVTTATATQLTLVTWVHSTCSGGVSSTAVSCQVSYTCTAGTCSRTLRNADGSGSGGAVQVAEGLASSNVFTYSPSPTTPTYVGVTLALGSSPGQSAVTLDDGAALGNVPRS